LTTHYLVEASFAPLRTGHDKGGVESCGKTIRWRQLVPISLGPDLRTARRRRCWRGSTRARCGEAGCAAAHRQRPLRRRAGADVAVAVDAVPIGNIPRRGLAAQPGVARPRRLLGWTDWTQLSGAT
jgi:hypothetical protein